AEPPLLLGLFQRGQPLPDQGGVEKRSGAGGGGQQQVLEHRIESGRNHDVQRNAETMLGMGDDSRRQPTRRQRAKYPLAGASVSLEAMGEAKSQSYDVLVQ